MILLLTPVKFAGMSLNSDVASFGQGIMYLGRPIEVSRLTVRSAVETKDNVAPHAAQDNLLNQKR